MYICIHVIFTLKIHSNFICVKINPVSVTLRVAIIFLLSSCCVTLHCILVARLFLRSHCLHQRKPASFTQSYQRCYTEGDIVLTNFKKHSPYSKVDSALVCQYILHLLINPNTWQCSYNMPRPNLILNYKHVAHIVTFYFLRSILILFSQHPNII